MFYAIAFVLISYTFTYNFYILIYSKYCKRFSTNYVKDEDDNIVTISDGRVVGDPTNITSENHVLCHKPINLPCSMNN